MLKIFLFCHLAHASIPTSTLRSLPAQTIEAPKPQMKTFNSFSHTKVKLSKLNESAPIFDIPMTYNARVKYWIKFFQTSGRKWFRTWLERSGRHLPQIQAQLRQAGLPLDLAYIVMIESGFSSAAQSHAQAVGPWQFIEATGTRYGLKTNLWIDERRDMDKSTKAAVRYLKDLYRMFQSWYLVAASYNTGENRIKRLIQRYETRDFWALAHKGAFSEETLNYVPKLLAATLIAKAPALYGFRDLQMQAPLRYEWVQVPGGLELTSLADYLSVTRSHLQGLNPELKSGKVPPHVARHSIRVPPGARSMVSRFLGRLNAKIGMDKAARSDYP